MKQTQVIWTEESLNDLETIYDFIAEKSSKSAKRIIKAILSRTRQLKDFPKSGTPQATNISTGKEYRYLIEGHYKIVYSNTGKPLYIEAIVDTRQDPSKSKL